LRKNSKPLFWGVDVLHIYFDNSATTKPSKVSIDAVVDVLKYDFGNPSSLHRLGLHAQNLITDAKKKISKSLGCLENEIYFTSGATESNNIAILGGTDANKRRGKKIVVSSIEHSSVLAPAKHLENLGYEVVRVSPSNSKNFCVNDFLKEVDKNTILISVMGVNNELGTILPFEDIMSGAKRINPDILTHIDFVAGYLKHGVRLKNQAIDCLSISGHKVFAPKGIGALYIKKGVKVNPITFGGGQENGIRVGTEATSLIAGFGASVGEFSPKIKDINEHYKSLNNYLRQKLLQITDIIINSDENCANHILNFSVLGVKSEIMLHFLESKNIYVSSGSACSKGKTSHVLSALGLEKTLIDSAIRISFCPENTTEEIDELIKNIEIAKNTLKR
jgi:cysteine desulfurase